MSTEHTDGGSQDTAAHMSDMGQGVLLKLADRINGDIAKLQLDIRLRPGDSVWEEGNVAGLYRSLSYVYELMSRSVWDDYQNGCEPC